MGRIESLLPSLDIVLEVVYKTVMTNHTKSCRSPRTRLAEIMESEGRRFTWLAREAGRSRQTVYNVANGLHPTPATAEAIAEALGREVEDVFPESQELAA